VLIAGRIETLAGTAQIDDSKYMADSREPVKRRALVDVRRGDSFSIKQTHPVKKRLPMLAREKSNLELGLNRLTISMLTTLKKLRMSSFFGADIPCHSGCVASTMSSHSCLAA